MLLLVLGTIVVLMVIVLIMYARWNYGVLEKMGVPVDKPHFIFGNTYYTCNRPAGFVDIEYFKKFGPVYGVYDGRQPQLHICDAELIRLITTKDADYFNGKTSIDFRNTLLNEILEFQPYNKWKILRSVLAPQISTAKFKQIVGHIVQSLDQYSEIIKEAVDSSPGKKLEKYDFRNEFFGVMTDIFAGSFFSLKIGSETDQRFVDMVRNFLSPTHLHSPFLDVIASSFPLISRFIPAVFDSNITDGIMDLFEEMLHVRKKSGERKNDLLDMSNDLMDKLDSQEFKDANINRNTVLTLSFIIFLGGQDQISSILSTMIYHVLQKSDSEQLFLEEIDRVMEAHNDQINYDALPEFKYVLACLTETLRLFPFFNRTERICTKDWTNEEFNLTIKKGMPIMIPIWAANRNPKYFEDPESFKPERFLPGNRAKLHSYAFTSFGFGPRGCPGQKLSIDLMILFSVCLFRKFRFHLREDSTPIYVAAQPQFTPHLPFFFDITMRN